MSDQINKAKLAIIEWRMAIAWFCFFTATSLTGAVLASLQNTNYSTMDTQGKLMMWLAVFLSWGNTMLAFFSRAAKKVERQFGDDTQFITRTQSVTDSLKVSPEPPAK
jgi:hypothetical protein